MPKISLVRLLLFAVVTLITSVASSAQVAVVVSFGPPALPIYEQPPCPAEGYLWTPGYWVTETLGPQGLGGAFKSWDTSSLIGGSANGSRLRGSPRDPERASSMVGRG